MIKIVSDLDKVTVEAEGNLNDICFESVNTITALLSSIRETIMEKGLPPEDAEDVIQKMVEKALTKKTVDKSILN